MSWTVTVIYTILMMIHTPYPMLLTVAHNFYATSFRFYWILHSNPFIILKTLNVIYELIRFGIHSSIKLFGFILLYVERIIMRIKKLNYVLISSLQQFNIVIYWNFNDPCGYIDNFDKKEKKKEEKLFTVRLLLLIDRVWWLWIFVHINRICMSYIQYIFYLNEMGISFLDNISNLAYGLVP